MSNALAARIEAVRGLLREAERAARVIAEDVDRTRAGLDPVDQPVAVEVIDSLADMGLALDGADAALDSAVRHARLLP
ncbi:hypothetical protein F1734_26025 (plasmid) [Rhodococcus ruber]|uniref:hypothetical protein n=1 Tax=Rhodococcus ruber TaxID=1830 RepID=UPI00111FFBC4|nr:hypothetical protein [Rhodococcus ruber]QDC17462.1 hypothetical protein E2561_25075 [Rhodococcus ruber]QRE83798.1 hypothetical protein F1734_26025 [Rhodococcus ruber]